MSTEPSPTPPSRTVHGDGPPVNNTESDGVSGWCDLGEQLVERALTGRADGRLLLHIDGCRRCREGVAS